MNKVKTKNSKGFSGRKQVISKKRKKNVVTEIQRDFAGEIRNSNSFSGRKQVISKKRKRSSSQKCHEIRCQSTKITKIPLANTILGLDLHSSSLEPVNFFGAQSSVGGAQFSFGRAQAVIWGARPRNASLWLRACAIASGCWGFLPHTPKHSPPIVDFLQ